MANADKVVKDGQLPLAVFSSILLKEDDAGKSGQVGAASCDFLRVSRTVRVLAVQIDNGPDAASERAGVS